MMRQIVACFGVHEPNARGDRLLIADKILWPGVFSPLSHRKRE
ncbi:hypothetical protein [Picosynechococcus sp. PCC 11901]|nr:hypothetical protein [Picosynechococcus sp. PCC 11901]